MEIQISRYEWFDLYRMAVGCLHLLLGRAIADFPESTVAHPSRWVLVNLSRQGPLKPEYKGYFPYKVIFYVWQNVVVPVLEDPTYQIITESTPSLRVRINQALLYEEGQEGMVQRIEAALLVRLKEMGMVHQDAQVGVSGVLENPVPPGEPIALSDTDPLDVGDDLVWPDGHSKLTYPIVDGDLDG